MKIKIQKQEWQHKILYILYCDGGTAQLEINKEPQSEFGIKAYFSHHWVNESYRRRGLAKILLAKAEEIAKENGHDCLWLEWNEYDTPREVLDRLYLANGYNDVVFGRTNALLRKDL